MKAVSSKLLPGAVLPFGSVLLFALMIVTCGCAPGNEVKGPDKQFEGGLEGAAVGAGAGAVTGFQVSAATGPGAAIGAGFGAVAGGIQGFLRDRTEDNLHQLSMETRKEKQRAMAHEILQEQYQRRIELHPTRDIYPADIFFYSDQVKLRGCAQPIVSEFVVLNKLRYPWSRLQVAVYTKSSETDSEYAQHLSEERAKALGNAMVRAGLEARRIETKAMVVDAAVLIDPADYPDRYSQAIEIIPIDR